MTTRASPKPDRLLDALAEVEVQLDRSGGGASPLSRVVQQCGLSPFETQVLLLCAAVELQPNFAALCRERAGAGSPNAPTFALAMSVLPGAHWGALLPAGPLRRLELIALEPGPVLTERPLRLAERVLHALLDVANLDPRVSRRVHPVAATGSIAPSHRSALPRIQAAWTASPPLPVHVQATRRGDAHDLAAHAAHATEAVAWRIDADEVPVSPTERDQLRRLWEREAHLGDVVLVVDLDSASTPGATRAATDLLRRLDCPAVAVSQDPLPDSRNGSWIRVRLDTPPWAERRAAWAEALAGVPIDDADLDDLVARFELDATSLEQVRAELALDTSQADPVSVLWDAARASARPDLEDLAQRIASRATRDHLVLPEPQSHLLDALVAQVRHKARVQHHWGLGGPTSRGSGTAAVFSGPSGTGKTLAAEVLANQLGLDLFRIDLSAVVSKYIGETEKNLRRVFDAAEAGGAVLLFDEADALFGSRTEVKDSHDRHANIEVSYLLQRMEAYGGLAILTTNFREAIDAAFLRRIQFVVEFPFPDTVQRRAIWARMFPPTAPTCGLELDRLAQLTLTGGTIRSVARNAAYLAADRGTPIDMGHLLQATRMEAQKSGRDLTPRELRGWPT